MLIFLDIEQQLIKLYSDNGIETFYFDEFSDFVNRVKNQPLLYIKSVTEVNIQDLSNVVNTYYNQSEGNALDKMDNQTYYLQSQIKGSLVIPISDKKNIIFDKFGDCQQIDAKKYEIIKTSSVVRSMIKQGKLAIVGYKEMQKSLRRQRKDQEKIVQMQKMRDKKLDEIIIPADRRAEDVAADMASGGSSDGILGDITNDILNDPSEKLTPEQLNDMIRRGKMAT
jgi:hypothetical protein